MRGAVLLQTGAFGLWELDALNELRLVRYYQTATLYKRACASGKAACMMCSRQAPLA